jgi:hypothetical protein
MANGQMMPVVLTTKKKCDGRTRLLAEKIPTGMGKGRNQEKNCGDHRHILDLYFVSA